MSRRVAAVLIVVALLGSGCAQLGVQVDILDPNYAHRVVTDGKLQAVYFDLQANGKSAASRVVRETTARVVSAGKKLATAYEALAEAKKGTAEAEGLQESAEALATSVTADTGTVRERERKYIADLESTGAAALNAASALGWRAEQAMPADLRVPLERVVQLQRKYVEEITTEVKALERQATLVAEMLKRSTGEATAQGEQTARAAAAELSSVASVAQRNIIGSGSIVNSEYAFVVAKAPDNFWSPAFNKAATTGLLGNVDFVIKMNSVGDFTVKGMRFDASTVASVASKVMTQALVLGTQIAGWPVPTTSGSAPTGDGSRLAEASGSLAASDALMAKRKASLDAWRQAVREMAAAILAEDAMITAAKAQWATEKAKVHTPIKTSFDALLPVLGLDGVQ